MGTWTVNFAILLQIGQEMVLVACFEGSKQTRQLREAINLFSKFGIILPQVDFLKASYLISEAK